MQAEDSSMPNFERYDIERNHFDAFVKQTGNREGKKGNRNRTFL